jgi:Glycoside hydrolase family 5 C-terminal domain/Cellulase (glycosyl hydrolase family 5)
VPTPFQSMLLGAGYPQDVSVWRLGRTSFKRTGTRRMNEARQSAWRDGYECIWRQNGVWDLDSRGVPQLLRPDHFSLVDGKAVNFTADYYQPFANRFAEAIRREHPQALIFIETDFDASMSKWTESDVGGIVYAPHWYDGYLVAKKVYTPLLGVDTTTRKIALGAPAIRRSFRNQLARHKQTALRDLGGVPVILGEFGIPFDLRDKEAYRTGDFRIQVRALQRSMQAVEDNLLNYALWTYTPDNNNLHGDLWNDEDFSIYSPDQRVDPRDINSGGRALQAVVRPYPVATAGELLEASFNCHRRIFRMRFRSDPASTAPCEVFVPNYQYPHGYSIKVSDGRYEIKPAQQLLLYWPGSERQEHKINIKP